MTMMVTNALYEEIVEALRKVAAEMGLAVDSIDTYNGIVKLKKGINWYTLGDIVQVNLFTVKGAQIVHVAAGVNDHGNVGMTAQYGYHHKMERQLIEKMRDHLGIRRCKVIP